MEVGGTHMARNKLNRLVNNHLVITTLLLSGKALLLRYLLFSELSVTKLIVLELSFILFLTVLTEMISVKGKPYFFLGLNVVVSTMFLALIIYYSYFGNMATYYALFQLGQVAAISDSVADR